MFRNNRWSLTSPEQIAAQVRAWAGRTFDLVLTTGGTGGFHPGPHARGHRPVVGPRGARHHGGRAQLWSGTHALGHDEAGASPCVGRTLVIALPGSTRGAQETLDALFPSCCTW